MINNKTYIECLENISINFDKMKEDQFYMREQLYEFKEEEKIYINFKECNVAICPNGGLIAICKKKGYLDITKNTKINDNIIVMHQTAQKKYLIPIDWQYNSKYFILFDFNAKEQLYGICNDGSIYKIDILTHQAVEKLTSNLFMKENLVKAQLFEQGFIALTTYGNFYYVKDIKNPIPKLFFQMKALLRFSNNIEFLIIPHTVSKSNKSELLITNEKGFGVVHVKISDDALYNIIPIDNFNENFKYEGISIIKKDILEPYIIDKDFINSTITSDKIEQDSSYQHENLRIIASFAISPSKKNIAFYDTRGIVFFFDSTLDLDINKYPRKSVSIKMEENKTGNVIIEQQMVINYGEGFQFLFCGEDAVILAGLRYIFLVHKYSQSISYKITDSMESIALKGMLFCKCLQEVDGVRYLSNDGIFFITPVNKDLADICSTFNSNYTKQLVRAYQYYINKSAHSEITLREIEDDLIKAIKSVEIAAANIFWIDDPSNSDNEKKEIQLFVLKAAQYGKSFVKKDEFNFDNFLEICKDIRCVNNLRNSILSRLITFDEYKSLESKDLIKKLMRNLNFGMAFEICHYLDYNVKKVYHRYAIARIKKLSNETKESDEERLFSILIEKLKDVPKISYTKLAKKALKYHKNIIGMRFLESEKSALAKIPQYIELKEWEKVLDICKCLYDGKIINTVLHKIYKTEGVDKFLNIVCVYPKLKAFVIQFLNNNYEYEKIGKYLEIYKHRNPEELFFFYLEQYFQSTSISERQNYISLAKKNLAMIDNSINPNFEHKFYKNYLESLNNNINIKKEVHNKNMITYEEDNTPLDISIYDLSKKIVLRIKDRNYSFIDSMTKPFGFSQEGIGIMKMMAICEDGRFTEIIKYVDSNKNQIKKTGLNYLNIAEIFYKFHIKQKAIEYIKLINEPAYINYKIEMVECLNDIKAQLEVIISDKNIKNKKFLVDNILIKNRDLQKTVDEFCDKYKIILKE